MKRYVGMDLSQDECAVCILSEDGARIFEGFCETDPDAFLQAIAYHTGSIEKIVHESGPLSNVDALNR